MWSFTKKKFRGIFYFLYVKSSQVLDFFVNFQLWESWAGLEITAGQRTMSGLIGDLTGQILALSVKLTGHVRSYWNELKFLIYAVVYYQYTPRYIAELWSKKMKYNWTALLLFTYNSRIETDIARVRGSRTSGLKSKIFSENSLSDFY